MSRVNQVVCDGCGKIQEDMRYNVMLGQGSSDRWWSVDVDGLEEHYDMCCLACLKKWAQVMPLQKKRRTNYEVVKEMSEKAKVLTDDWRAKGILPPLVTSESIMEDG